MEHYLGAKIKELRQGRNWTQSYLAARLNKSVSTVSGYESDAHPIPTDVLISIAELFGVSLDVLLDLEKPTCVSTQDCQFHRWKLLRHWFRSSVHQQVQEVILVRLK